MRILLIIGTILQFTGAFPQDSVNRVDAQGRKQGYWKKHDSAGSVIYEGQFRDDIPYGKFVYYFPDGMIRTVSVISQEGKVAHTSSWFPNGKLMARGKYLDQRRDSLWQYFSELDGSLVSEEHYRIGVKHGPEKIFYPGKGIAEIIPWKTGVKEGKWEQFYDDGTLKLIGYFKEGEKNGPLQTYYVSGEPMVSGHYSAGHQDSLWIYYDKKGKVTQKEYYDNGILLKREELTQ